jgi:hypothetical protein
MKNQFVTYLCLTTLALTQACSNNSRTQSSTKKPKTVYHKIDFNAFIGKHKNDSLDYYEALLSNKEFVNVLEHGEYYKDEVNTFLKRGEFTNMQVAVCICAMQNLKVNDYVKLCTIILTLYNNNELPEKLLEHAIDPDFLRKHILAYHYKEPCVTSLIKSIENDPKVTDKDLRAWLPDVLSGKSAKDLHQFEKENYSN